MLLSDFDYNLPEEFIALEPLEQKDCSKILHLDNNGNIKQSIVRELIPQFLQEGDLLIFNNSKVIPALLYANCSDRNYEINLVKRILDYGIERNIWQGLVKKSRKLKIGDKLTFCDDFGGKQLSQTKLTAIVIHKNDDGLISLEFNLAIGEFFQKIEEIGQMPLPPYIAKKRKANEADNIKYQNIYADNSKKGSAAAPTAGFHFTKELLKTLQDKGVEIGFVTLHVGAGTFLPVRVDNILEHKMHSEYYEITSDTATKICQAKQQGRRIICVGTTSLRTLEATANQILNSNIVNDEPLIGETDIFIYPSYKFKLVDCLITNFHLPKSTLLMLVSAFSGKENILRAYEYAKENNFRFFSFGDAMLLER